MTYDVVIVGGSAMGAATAYHLLSRDPSMSIAVIEKDPTYRYASTVLSDGNVRIQFNLEENIRISQYAMEALEAFADDMEVDGVRPEVSMRKQGNLFLVDEETRHAAEQGVDLQRKLGCAIEWLSADQIADAYPPFAGPQIVGGTLGRLDGSVDPNAVLQGYRRKSIALGADFITGQVTSLNSDGDSIRGVTLASGETIRTGVVVNASGAWARDLLATVGIDLPVIPVMRHVHVVESPILSTGLPSAFLPSGLYLIPEHDGTWLMAWSQPDDPVGFDFSVHRHRFYDIIWPHLIEQLPAFDRLRVVGGWAGLYAVNTLDGNAILGEWPEMRGLYLANGFSGHGFQQCHAVGRYLAELILRQTPTLDLSRLGPRRILEGSPLFEHAGRII
ncbi:hydrogen cyanide synthase subunit HcnC precursor [bacterium BMS3Abin02]|nr:hydrogen cyanide synthase subunit HcnC precursor [bacterium BMS3Abin02]